jgi:hypothetical protein
MQRIVDAQVAKMWTIEGKPNMSLLDAGYSSMGIDEGWEGYGQGVNKTQHDAQGKKAIKSCRVFAAFCVCKTGS